MVEPYTSKPDTYLEICDVTCFKSLQEKILGISDEKWRDVDRNAIGSRSLKDTLTIVILNSGDPNSALFANNIFNEYMFNLLQGELESIFTEIEKVYPNGDPKRVMLASLPAGCKIDQHVDHFYHLTHSRRIHLPIFTNENVDFTVDNVKVPMKEGKLIEFNNNKKHSVKNNSSSNRIHLIIDWYIKDDPFYKSSSYKNLTEKINEYQEKI